MYHQIKKRREDAKTVKPYSVSVQVAPRSEENVPKCPSQENPRLHNESLRSKIPLNQANQLNKSLTEHLHISVQENSEVNSKNILKYSASLLKDEISRSKNKIRMVKNVTSFHAKVGQDQLKKGYLPDLTIHRKVSTTKIIEADEIFGFNKTSAGIGQAFAVGKKKEPLRIMSNKTLEEIRSPVKGSTIAAIPPIDRKEEEFLFPTYFNGRMRYPKEEELIISKAINGGKIGYRTNLRSMKLKAVQERLLAEKGIRGFFNIKNQSKDNSREVSLNIDIGPSKRKDNHLEEALNELKDSLSVADPGILGNNRS